jgi:hypothetical protein
VDGRRIGLGTLTVRGVRTRLALVMLALALLLPAAASASLAGEQRQGQSLIAQLHAGTVTCRALSADDLDHIGEYVMFHALGSTTRHQAMNGRMVAMLGEQAEGRMHQLLGARYAGCTTSSSATGGYGGMMGAGTISGGAMMGGYATNGGISAMMRSDNWSWMMGGAWQHMTRQDWQRLQHQLLGTPLSTARDHGWSMVAMMAAVIGGVVLVSGAIVAMLRRPFRRPPTAASSP